MARSNMWKIRLLFLTEKRECANSFFSSPVAESERKEEEKNVDYLLYLNGKRRIEKHSIIYKHNVSSVYSSHVKSFVVS
jgi:hypothetical protein